MDDTEGNVVDVQPGAAVYGSDGEKVGSVIEVGPDYMVVEKGFFFPSDYFVPRGAIAAVGAGQVTLNVTRDEALRQGWENDPAERGPATDAHADHDPGFQGDFDGVAVTGFGPAVERQPGDPVRTGFATQVGTTPPAADFQTLGVAPVDVNTAYVAEDAGASEASPTEPSKGDERRGSDPR